MPAPRKYPQELRERAMGLVGEARNEDLGLSVNIAVKRIGQRVGVNPDTLRDLDEAASQEDWQTCPTYDGRPNPDWQLYSLDPDEFEFMQARENRNQTRVEYVKRPDDTWLKPQSHHTRRLEALLRLLSSDLTSVESP